MFQSLFGFGFGLFNLGPDFDAAFLDLDLSLEGVFVGMRVSPGRC
jgi:hypothetical protein